jgi:hypothetical protein
LQHDVLGSALLAVRACRQLVNEQLSVCLQAHDEQNECNIGDTVRVHISRPLSKRKCWMVTQVIHRARVFDAEAATKAAAADAAAHHAGPPGAPSFAASALTSTSSAAR